ncbi:MAG: hypothetical protein OXT74_11545 [Candidatus Poribacteria bacterium]|nr:hypothetical protein [Candidatus Poribacteria bacterium]
MTNINIDQIKYLYYHEKKSVPEIAAIFGCSPAPIYARMQENGMQRRSYSEAHKLRCAQNVLDLDLEEIVRLYFEERLTIADVGKRLGVSSYTVQKRLIAAGYKPRKKSPCKPRRSRFTDGDISEMKRLYCEGKQSLAKIARQYDCADITVMTHLKRQGVQLRTLKEARALRRKKTEQKPEDKTRTHTPPKRLGKVFEPIPLLPEAEVTPERILQLYREDRLLIDDIAVVCSLSNVEVYNILKEAGGT